MNYLEYAKRFQAWRTGEDERTMFEAGIEPSKVTATLNWLIEQAESKVHCGSIRKFIPFKEDDKVTLKFVSGPVIDFTFNGDILVPVTVEGVHLIEIVVKGQRDFDVVYSPEYSTSVRVRVQALNLDPKGKQWFSFDHNLQVEISKKC